MLPKGERCLAEMTVRFRWHPWVLLGVRLAMAGMLALIGVAVLVGRSFPPRPAQRVPGHPSFVYVNHYLLGLRSEGLLRLDPDMGLIEPLPLPEGEVLEYARGSPWRDTRGRWQVAGR